MVPLSWLNTQVKVSFGQKKRQATEACLFEDLQILVLAGLLGGVPEIHEIQTLSFHQAQIDRYIIGDAYSRGYDEPRNGFDAYKCFCFFFSHFLEAPKCSVFY